MLNANDAILIQMPDEGAVFFGSSEDGSDATLVVDRVQQFVVIPLGAALLDGYHKWGLELPRIAERKPAPPEPASTPEPSADA